MSRARLLCYITDRTQFPGGEASRQRRLLEKIAEASRCGVDYVQLREKDLSTRDFEQLAALAVGAVGQSAIASRNPKPQTRLLINSGTDVALAVGADGVNLRANDITPADARRVWSLVSSRNPKSVPQGFIIGVSCHSASEVARAAEEGADFALFGPVFEKRDSPHTPAGLENLRQACQHKMPILALGGVTLENARACFDAGAAGIAAIRLFQENEISEVVQTVRGLAVF
jgi:thiamine-phosphate pyrophosphorylase